MQLSEMNGFDTYFSFDQKESSKILKKFIFMFLMKQQISKYLTSYNHCCILEVTHLIFEMNLG